MARGNRKILLKFFVATSLLALLPFVVARWQENRRRNAPKTSYTFPFAELAALDKVVQARFAEVPTRDFGAARVGNRHEVFIPQTPEEKSTVGALKARGYEVVFYVAGRRYIKGKRTPYGKSFIQGPIYMTNKPQVTPVTPYTYTQFSEYYGFPAATPLPGLPGKTDIVESPLKSPAQHAFYEFETSEGTDFEAGDWKVSARPVRATNQACVDCHNKGEWGRDWPFGDREKLQLGDTLGVAMYAYRTKKKGQK